MGFPSILSAAHRLASERVRPGEPVVDATVGGGNDTLFLARLTGPSGVVYGFDIQPDALELARRKAGEAEGGLARLVLHPRSHAAMEEAIPGEDRGRIAAVMFNLGYLPGGDHRIITRPAETLPALDAALRLLRRDGVLTVVAYSGHEGGEEEAAEVERWAAALPQERYQAMEYRFLNQRNRPPFLMAVSPR